MRYCYSEHISLRLCGKRRQMRFVVRLQALIDCVTGHLSLAGNGNDSRTMLLETPETIVPTANQARRTSSGSVHGNAVSIRSRSAIRDRNSAAGRSGFHCPFGQISREIDSSTSKLEPIQLSNVFGRILAAAEHANIGVRFAVSE